MIREQRPANSVYVAIADAVNLLNDDSLEYLIEALRAKMFEE